MPDLGKFLVVTGIALTIVGIFVWLGVGRGWFGRLPGDINYSSKNVSFHFPVVTCILLSIVVSLLLRLFKR